MLFEDRRFGRAADRVVVEECLEGEELSFIALSDGERLLNFATSKDYKRIGEDDTGPNTGGMGAHSPSGVLSGEAASGVVENVMRPTIAGMAAEGRPFIGVLYAGLMLTDDGPKVLEYNVRFGDPEAQPLFMRLEDDLLPVLASGAKGKFEVSRLHFRKAATSCIVLASAGYPGDPVKGEPITGIGAVREVEGAEVFHAGTALKDGKLVASGGRVLNVCGSGPHLQDALKLAYEAASKIQWPSKVLRRDIGRRVLTRET
jgi:phosphoribosylamine--glycine ligase